MLSIHRRLWKQITLAAKWFYIGIYRASLALYTQVYKDRDLSGILIEANLVATPKQKRCYKIDQ